MTRRLAAIDLGSNTVRVLVADADAARGLAPCWADQVVARLGEGVATHGRFAPAAVARALAAVRAFHARARALGAEAVLLVGTAAVRQARDRGHLFARLHAMPGLRPRVLTGGEEARLTVLGTAWGLGLAPGRSCLLDVGGGSTELAVWAGPRLLGAVSLRLGAVSLAERFFAHDPVEPGELRACAAYVQMRLARGAWPTIRPHRPRRLVATAGTPTTLAALDLGLHEYDPAGVQGHRLRRGAVERLLHRLAALPCRERARLPALEPGRADVIVPGTVVLLAALRGLGLRTLVVADAGLREGVLLDAVGWRPAGARARAPRAPSP